MNKQNIRATIAQKFKDCPSYLR